MKKEPRITHSDFCQMVHDTMGRGAFIPFYEWHIPKKLFSDVLLAFELYPHRILGIRVKWVDGDVLELVRWHDSIY